MEHKLSSVIITLNEERNIARCIDSLRSFSDEIIVLDAFSTDNTVEICKEKGVSIHQREWKGYSNAKNYLQELAQNEYILSVDADEAPDLELQKAIQKEIEKGLEGIYVLNRLTNYCGQWIRHSSWYPDKKIRIFPKSHTKWTGEFVHEELEFDTNFSAKELPGHLLHYSYYNHREHRERADKYSLLTAQKLWKNGKKAGFLKPYISAIGRFITMYFIKGGILDGNGGFHIALISAQSNILKYKELRRLQHEENK
ncbi:MAG: glycosyltransferase family 2 protein [Brumimicrobium sp.]|nr:glycosyltransferase family 2 protein [Brumimicrobium sp.]